MLTEESLEVLLEWLPRDALRALDMVDRQTLAIDWHYWYRTFVILEELGFIVEDEKTAFNVFVHHYSFTELGLRVWKYYLTKKVGKAWWHNLALLRR